MIGVLLLAHGSRKNETEATMETITGYVKEELQIELVQCAYLQFREKNLEKGLLNLIGAGADEIKIVPYFLFEGVHIKEDIPAELHEFIQNHSNIKFSFGATLGADKRLAMIVADRVREMI